MLSYRAGAIRMARSRNGYISYRYEGERRVAIVAGTGVKVWVIVGYQRLGMSDIEIQDALPHLTLTQIHAALAYYREHPQDIDRVLDYNNSLTAEEAKRLQEQWAAMVRIRKREAEVVPG